MNSVFCIVDCDNFYSSCQKLFRPDLKDRPLIVFSNNDSCVVARSKEAKALGIKMGDPVFKIRDQIEQHNIACFSSNYALYADMSARVMTILEEEAAQIEVYSIDEAFLDLTGVSHVEDLAEFGARIKRKVHQWCGISVGVGIAPTKTLAKLANRAAKKYPATNGVVDLMDPERQRRLMALVDVSDVWGVGRRISERLKSQGIHTALDLANANPKAIRKEFSVVLERTLQELNGHSCLDIESVAPVKQQIVCSRSFGERITEKSALQQAVAKYTARAAEKLRGEGRVAKAVQVFIRTGLFNSNDPRHVGALSTSLSIPTSDTRVLMKATDQLLSRLYRAGYRYAKAGVMLSDFYDPQHQQMDLFATTHNPKSETLMSVIDAINQKGRGQLFFASQGTTPQWLMKREMLSPSYTTNWDDLPVVR